MTELLMNTSNMISIITIVRNGVYQIEETIKSVISQKNVNIEYIIIDGKSTDGTLEIIEKYKDSIAIILSESDSGIFNAINKGIKLATGVVVGLIHCGDYYEPNALCSVVKEYHKTSADIIYGNINTVCDDASKLKISSESADHTLLTKRMSIYHPATFVSRECYLKNGLYNEQYIICSDYEYFLKMFMANVSFQYLPKILANFRTGGISGNRPFLRIKENINIRSKYLGDICAFRYAVRVLPLHLFYSFRKSLIERLIGKNHYAAMKEKKYRET